MKKPLLTLILALTVICTPLAAARATILFAGSEDSDFTCLGECYATTTAGYFNSGYVREALFTVGWWSSLLSPTFTASSTLWIHAVYGNWGIDNGLTPILEVYSPDGVDRIDLYASNTGQTLTIRKVNAAGTATNLATMSGAAAYCFSRPALHPLDLYINYSTTGEVALYCDGAKVADYTGDVTTDSATQLDQFSVWDTDTGDHGNQPNYSQDWSEFIVATTNTTAMHLVTLAASGAGATDNWTGAYTDVNEVTLNDTTINSTTSSGQIQLYTVGSLPSGTFSILDVGVNMRAQVDTTGPQHIDAMVRTTDGSNHISSNLAPPQSSWGPVWAGWATNPHTSAAWTASDLGSGFNTGFESQP